MNTALGFWSFFAKKKGQSHAKLKDGDKFKLDSVLTLRSPSLICSPRRHHLLAPKWSTRFSRPESAVGSPLAPGRKPGRITKTIFGGVSLRVPEGDEPAEWLFLALGHFALGPGGLHEEPTQRSGS